MFISTAINDTPTIVGKAGIPCRTQRSMPQSLTRKETSSPQKLGTTQSAYLSHPPLTSVAAGGGRNSPDQRTSACG